MGCTRTGYSPGAGARLVLQRRIALRQRGALFREGGQLLALGLQRLHQLFVGSLRCITLLACKGRERERVGRA